MERTTANLHCSTPAPVMPSAASETSSMPGTTITIPTPLLTCNWTEHTSPQGFKYYYNSVTGESKWEKPEEFSVFEQNQQQQQKLLLYKQQQQKLAMSQTQIQPNQQIPQAQLVQNLMQLGQQAQQMQLLQPSLACQAHGTGNQQNIQGNMVVGSYYPSKSSFCTGESRPKIELDWSRVFTVPRIISESPILATFDEYFEKYPWYIRSSLYGFIDEGCIFMVSARPGGADSIVKATHIINGKEASIRRILYIFKIPKIATAGELISTFSEFGKVEESDFDFEFRTMRGWRFGLIVFDSEKVVDELAAKGTIEFCGEHLEVKKVEVRIAVEANKRIQHSAVSEANMRIRLGAVAEAKRLGAVAEANKRIRLGAVAEALEAFEVAEANKRIRLGLVAKANKQRIRIRLGPVAEANKRIRLA